MIPTHLTVIFGDATMMQHTGVGPSFRRVTVELTAEQRDKLRYRSADCEEIHHTMLETILEKGPAP